MSELEKLRAENARLWKKTRDLAAAFNNVDEERCFYRAKAARLRGLLKQAESELCAYEGQYNIYAVPVVAPHERRETDQGEAAAAASSSIPD